MKIIILFFCLFISSQFVKAQKEADSTQIKSIIKKIESFGNNSYKKAEYFSELDHQYLERYGQQLYPYIKKEYDNLEQSDLPRKLKFEVTFLMKDNYFIFGEYDKAAKLSYDMLDMATQINDSLFYYYSYISIADVEREMENTESSLDFLLRAKTYAAIDKSALAQIYTDLASLYLGEGKLQLAKDNVLKGIELAKSSKDYFQSLYGYETLMTCQLSLGEMDQAIQSYQKVDSIVNVSHFLETSRLYVNATIYAAEIYRDRGDVEKSRVYFQQAYNIAKESNDRPNLTYIYYEWAKLEELNGNYPKSIELLRSHISLNDSLHNETSLSQINTLKTTFELEKKDLALKTSLQNEKYVRNQFWLVLAGGVVFISALVILTFFLKTKLKAEKLKVKLNDEQHKLSKIKLKNLEREVQLKNKELADLFLHQFEKASMLNDVIDKVDASSVKLKQSLQEHQDKRKDWIKFKAHFDKVHEGFFDKLNELSTELTPKDIRFCAYIRMNLSSKEIAIMLGISHRTVQGIRSRVRRKLNLSSKEDIVKFLMNL